MWGLMVCRLTSFKSRRKRLVGHVTRMGDRRVAYSVVVRKSEFQRPLGIPWNGWFDNIKMDLQEVLWGSLTGFIWFRKYTGGGLFWMCERTFWCNKMRRIWKPVSSSGWTLSYGVSYAYHNKNGLFPKMA